MQDKSIHMSPQRELVDRLGLDIYDSPEKALWELVANGYDGHGRTGTPPEIDVFIWEGSHPLARGKQTLAFLDRGCGFTDEVRAAYGSVGKSHSKGNVRLHGTHGLGKLVSAAAVGAGGQYHILSAPGNQTLVDHYTFSADEVLSHSRSEYERIRRDDPRFPKMPLDGSFSMILLPGCVLDVTAQSLFEPFREEMPLREATVRINGKIVPLRQTLQYKELVTPKLGMLGGITISFRFDKAKSIADNDGVLLVDSNTGRIVTDLGKLGRSVKRQLDTILLDPRLVGIISVPGIEKFSDPGRGDLKGSFWKDQRKRRLTGSGFLTALNHYGASFASELLGEDPNRSKDDESQLLDRLSSLFSHAFGESESAPQTRKNKEPGKSRDNADAQRSTSSKTSPPNTDEKKTSEEKTPRRRHPHLNIEGVVYPLMFIPQGGKHAATVHSSGFMVICKEHPAVVSVLNMRSVNDTLRHLTGMAIGAHLRHERSRNSKAETRDVYDIWHQIFPPKK